MYLSLVAQLQPYRALIALMWTKELFVLYQRTNVNEANIYSLTREVPFHFIVSPVAVDIIVLPAKR